MQGLPEAYSKGWYKLKQNAEYRIDRFFNSVTMDNLKSICPDWYEYVVVCEINEKDLEDNGYDVKNMDENEIESAKEEIDSQNREIMWNTLWEAKDADIAEEIQNNAERIERLAGFTVVDLSDWLENNAYSTGVFLGVNGAGYDFYEAHWVPLCRLLGWDKVVYTDFNVETLKQIDDIENEVEVKN